MSGSPFDELIGLRNELIDRYNKRHWKWLLELAKVLLFLVGVILCLPLMVFPQFPEYVKTWLVDRKRHVVDVMAQHDDGLRASIEGIDRRIAEIKAAKGQR